MNINMDCTVAIAASKQKYHYDQDDESCIVRHLTQQAGYGYTNYNHWYN